MSEKLFVVELRTVRFDDNPNDIMESTVLSIHRSLEAAETFVKEIAVDQNFMKEVAEDCWWWFVIYNEVDACTYNERITQGRIPQKEPDYKFKVYDFEGEEIEDEPLDGYDFEEDDEDEEPVERKGWIRAILDMFLG